MPRGHGCCNQETLAKAGDKCNNYKNYMYGIREDPFSMNPFADETEMEK